jgi:hypothetical protein
MPCDMTSQGILNIKFKLSNGTDFDNWSDDI